MCLSPGVGHRFDAVVPMMIRQGRNEDTTSVSSPGACRWLTARGGGSYPGRGAGRTRETRFSTPANSLLSNPENEARWSRGGSEPCGISSSLLTCPALPSTHLQSVQRPKCKERPCSPAQANRAKVLSKVHIRLGPPPSHGKAVTSLLQPQELALASKQHIHRHRA